MESVSKRYPGVLALDKARFDLRPGEVHALVGENGAGKSTLVKILSGIATADSGEILLEGKPLHLDGPRSAQDLGISIIHQELNLMPDLTIAQNIFIGREPRKLKFILNDSGLAAEVSKLFKQLHLELDPNRKVQGLSVAQQQMVEITKALSFNSKVLIMDEPTAALTNNEINKLFTVIRGLKAKGVGIIYISHRLEELKQISDRITVMRDGKYVDTLDTKEAAVDKIISMMVGRTLFQESPHIPSTTKQPVVLEVRNLNNGRFVKNISFKLYKGEILGFAGLVGAGRTEVLRTIFGADRLVSGEIFINNQKVEIHTPQDALKHGIGYLSEDRKQLALALSLDIEANTVLGVYKKFAKFGLTVNKKIQVAAERQVKNLSIRTPTTKQRVGNLSGGNQQKVAIGKWLTTDSRIIIFDEPTRGIDVGAKSEINKLMNDLIEQGKSIIMISSELPEILRMSHRILVMCEGRITGELLNKEANQESIMAFATMRN
ncbi:MAG: sugar ABC transporter ATP-binding protein [Actinobacteria bacterium]|nr:sugar ABC transporter ATP-binding protein [Actinomycetota bacterium]